MTYSPTFCAVSTGSDRRQPWHERRHPVPSRRRRQDRFARIAGKNANPRHQLVLNHPDRRYDGCQSKENCTASGFEIHSTGWEGSIWGISSEILRWDRADQSELDREHPICFLLSSSWDETRWAVVPHFEPRAWVERSLGVVAFVLDMRDYTKDKYQGINFCRVVCWNSTVLARRSGSLTRPGRIQGKRL